MELLLVLMIIGLLAALVGPTFVPEIKPAKQSRPARSWRTFDGVGRVLR